MLGQRAEVLTRKAQHVPGKSLVRGDFLSTPTPKRPKGCGIGVEILIPASPWFIQKLVMISFQPWPLPALLSWSRSLVTGRCGEEVSTCRK